MLETRWNLMRRRLLVVLLPVLLAAGCDDFGFWPSSVPQVAGTYNGTLTLTFPLGSDTVTGSMSMVVVQDGERPDDHRVDDAPGRNRRRSRRPPGPWIGTVASRLPPGGFAGIMSDPTCGDGDDDQLDVVVLGLHDADRRIFDD